MLEIGVIALFSLLLVIFVFYKNKKFRNKFSTALRTILYRQQPGQSMPNIIKAGFGGLVTIGLVAVMSNLTDSLLLMAPFGASCVLLFSVPQSPLSQPINVIAGHLISTFIGLLLHHFLANEWWVLGLAVGLAIAVMMIFRVTHPPAGADPLVVFFTDPGWWYIIFPVAIGSIVVVFIAWLFHKLPVKTPYPTPVPEMLTNENSSN